ncbi:hypothetical protein ACF0H5_021869 [Mactra antiquata]
MCCAIQYLDISQKMRVSTETTFNCSMRKMKVDIESMAKPLTAQKKSTRVSQSINYADLGARPKVSVVESHVGEENKTDKKKKRKWKPLSLSECGFNLSLFPRPTRPEMIDPEEEASIIEKIENELEEYDEIVHKYKDMDVDKSEIFEGGCKSSDKLSRPDRDRKVQKAGRQIKHKNCTSVKNNRGRRKLFIHHRLFKLINLEEKRLDCHLPARSKYRENDSIAFINKNKNETKSRLKPYQPAPVRRPAPVQNLRFALQNNNAASDIDSALVNVLINLQHRELTPEDYEILLQLDDSVAPKTIDKTLLDNFKTDTVNETSAGDICPVCMEVYMLGESRKYLPCNHVFHSKCIDMWLENSSRNCPIDGLPVDDDS